MHKNEENYMNESDFAGIHMLSMDAKLLDKMELFPSYASSFVFAWVEDGKATYHVNSQSIEVKTGDVLILSPRMLVGIDSYTSSFKVLLCQANIALTENILTHTTNSKRLSDHFITNTLPFLSTQNTSEGSLIQDTFRIMKKIDLLDLQAEELQEMKANLLKMLIILISKQLDSTEKANVCSHKEIIYGKFLALVSKNYHEHHSTKYYAEALHITPVYLARIVKQYAEKTVKEFILNLLYKDAEELLRHSDLEVSQIASHLGFIDIGTFSKFFKSRSGCSPSYFRNKSE